MRRALALALAAVILAAALGAPDDVGRARRTEPPRDPVAARSALLARAPSAPGPSELREHAEDVADYTLHARLDAAAHTIHGDGSIRFRNTSAAAVDELWLHLYLNAFKNERSTFLREPVAGFRGSSPVGGWGTIDLRTLSLRGVDGATDLLPALELRHPDAAGESDDDETDARVPLPRSLLPGETITLDVVWDDKLPTVVERTGYSGSFHFAGQWFPKLARLEPDGTWAHFPFHHLAEFYADFGTYDVTLDVPASFTIGSTGPALDSRREEGRLIERHVQGDVHDFAWTAWDAFESREETIGDTRVKVLYPKGYDDDARRELAAVRFALPYFAGRYGPYPYPVLTLVHPPDGAAEAGGMEYPTLITTGGAWYGSPFTKLLELVTVHELGHQYFYGLLASNEERWPFLDEGLNSYAEADVMRAMFGGASAGRLFDLTISDEAVQAVFANAAEHEEPVAQPAHAFATGGRYSALVYERTATILETLRRVYGDPAMARAMGAYARGYRFLHPGPEDLIRTFAEELGGEAAGMLRRALFDKGWVDYAVIEVASHGRVAPRGLFDKDGKRDTVASPPVRSDDFDGWVLVERRGTLSFPVPIELVRADGGRERVAWDGVASTMRIPYHGPSKLAFAVVDPDHTVLLDDNLTNNHASADGVTSPGASRSFERATYWAELLVSGAGP